MFWLCCCVFNLEDPLDFFVFFDADKKSTTLHKENFIRTFFPSNFKVQSCVCSKQRNGTVFPLLSDSEKRDKRAKSYVYIKSQIVSLVISHSSLMWSLSLSLSSMCMQNFLYIYVARKIITYFLREYILFPESFTIWWTKSSPHHVFRLRRIILWWEE